MGLIDHAKRELKILGYIPLDQEQEDSPNKWIQENVLELLEVFSKQGHSGSSAPYAISMFTKLASFEPLTPILGTDDEWIEVTDDLYQNNRVSSVFKNKTSNEIYSIDAIRFRTPNGTCWGGSALTKDGKRIGSKQNIKLPYTPKTFYVDVDEKELSKDDWEFYIKDESQLKEVFEYYEYKKQ